MVMRRFFTSIYSNSSENSNDDSTDSSNTQQTTNTNETPSKRKTQFIRGRFGKSQQRSNSLNAQAQIDDIQVSIEQASNILADTVQEIISDTSHLSGDNLQGYILLVEVLEGRKCFLPNSSDPNVAAMSVLLSNTSHPKFVEICYPTNIATGLFQALRLLRMLEMKHNKQMDKHLQRYQKFGTPGSTSESVIDNESRQVITFQASKNICTLLQALCTEPSTIEQIRPLLTKIFTFPLGLLPSTGKHMQLHIAQVISSICRTGFTSQQIWYLHDIQMMTHLIRQMLELTSVNASSALTTNGNVENSNSPLQRVESERDKDFGGGRSLAVLKGLEAEKEGLWNIALKVLVELISCTIGVSTVLYHDFETVGGLKLLVHILQHSSADHFLHILNTITLLFFDPSRQEESTLTFASIVGTVLEFLLSEILKLERPIYPNDPLETLIFFSKQILNHSVLTPQLFLLGEIPGIGQANTPKSREYIIQGMCYSLLTLYSNDAQKSITLEETYCFLPTLILSLPALVLSESFSAILTTINYVCQCGFDENIARMPLLSLCAATTAIVHQALDISLPESVRLLSVHKLELCFISMDAINKSNPRFALEMLRSGFLKTIAFEPFEMLVANIGRYHVSPATGQQGLISPHSIPTTEKNQSSASHVDEISLQTYQKIINLLVDFNQKSPYAAQEIRKSGIHPLLRRVLGEKVITGAFVSSVLRLSEELSKVDTVNLQECIVAILALTRVVAGASPPNYMKISCFFLSLWKILLENEDSCVEYLHQGGIDAAMEILQTMDNIFASGLDETKEEEALRCLESIMRYLSLLVFHANFRNEIPLSTFHWQLAQNLLNTQIFTREGLMKIGIELVFSYLTLFSYKDKFFNPSGLEVVSCLFCFVPVQCSALFLKRLFKYLEYVVIRSSPSSQFQSCRTGSYRLNRTKCMQLHQTDSMIALCRYVTSFRFYPKGTEGGVKGNEYVETCDESMVYELFLHLLVIVYHEFPSIETFLLLVKYGLQPLVNYERCQTFHINQNVSEKVLVGTTASDSIIPEGLTLKSLFPGVASEGIDTDSLFPLNPSTFPTCAASCTGFGEVPSFHIPVCKVGEDSTEDEQHVGLASSLALFFSESSVFLPQNSIALACWFKVGQQLGSNNCVSVMLPSLLQPENNMQSVDFESNNSAPSLSLFSLELGSDEITISLELNVQTHEITVLFTSNAPNGMTLDGAGNVVSSKKQETVLFKPILVPNYFSTWCHCVLVLKRVKRFLTSANTTQCSVYMNGAAWSVANSNNPSMNNSNNNSERRGSSGGNANSVDFDCLTCLQNSELRLGFSPYSVNSIPRVSNCSLFTLKIASVTVFPDIISSKQIAMMYLKGPQYTGFHQSSSTLTDSLSTLSSHSLRCANLLAKNALNYLNKTNLSGLEFVVEPKVEVHKESVNSFDSPTFISPIVVVSASCCILSQPSFMYFACKDGDSCDELEKEKSHMAPKKLEQFTPNDIKYFTKTLPTRYSVFNISDLDTYSTIATLNAHHLMVHPTFSLGHCLASVGGPSYLIPLLLQVQDEESLQSFMVLLNQCVRSSLYNLKAMQSAVVKMYSYIFTYLPKAILTESTLHSLFQLTLDISFTSHPVGSVSPSISSAVAESWLLVDSVAMSYLIMNNMFWDYEGNFGVFMSLLKTWKQLLIDEKFTAINAMRLSSLGATRWLLCLVLQIVQNQASQQHNSSNSWGYIPRTSFEMADYRDLPDEFLHTTMIVIRILMASELRNKDLELVTNTIQFTFNYPSATLESSDFGLIQGSSIPFAVNTVDKNSDLPFCTYDHSESDSSHLHHRKLTGMEFFRVYLMRLVMNILEDNMEDMKAQQSTSNSNLRKQSTASISINSSAALNSLGGNGGLNMQNVSNQAVNNSTVQSTGVFLEKFEIFRDKCSMAWLFSVFERAVEANDVATKACTFRLIGILIQQDIMMYKDFQSLHGCQFLYHHLTSSPQEIPILLPLIALVFKLPLSLLLYPIQIQLDLRKLLQIFELDECDELFSFAFVDSNTNSVGSGTPSFTTDFCLPMLHLFHECLTSLIRSDRREVPWAENAVHLLLGIVEYAMEKLNFFRSLMQHKVAIEMHMTLYLSCTNAYVEDGPQIYGNYGGSATESNLTAFVVDDYVNAGTIQNRVKFVEAEVQELKSQRMALLMASPQISVIGKRCAQLSIRILTDGLTKDYENSKVLQYFLTSFPSISGALNPGGGSSCILSSYEYGYQMYVMDVIERVIFKFSDENHTDSQGQIHQLLEILPVYMSITRNFTNLVHLVKGNFLYDESLIKLLSLSFYLLEKMAIIPSSMLVENVGDQYLHIFRELVQNARYLSLLCLLFVLQGSVCYNEKTKHLSKLPILSLIRSNLQHLFPTDGKIIEDNLDSYISFYNNYSASASTYSNLLASSATRSHSAVLSASSPTIPFLASAGGNSNSSSNVYVAPSSSGLEERSMSFSVNTTSVPSNISMSSASQRKAPNMNAITQLRTERNRINSVFFVFLMWYCSQWILEEDKALRVEAIRILAYLARFRKTLSEQLVGNATNQMIHKVLSSWWNNGGVNEGEFDLSIDLFRDGFMKLVPNKSGKYELFLGNTNSSTGEEEMSTELEENRYADFAYWISYHQTKFDKWLRNMDISLGSLLPNLVQEEEDLLRFLSTQLRLSDLWKNVNHAEMARLSQHRSEAVQKLGDRMLRELSVWKNHGVKEMTFGMATWHQLRSLILCNPIWGRNVIENGSPTEKNLYQKIIWRVDFATVTPELTHKKLVQDISPVHASLFGSIPSASLIVNNQATDDTNCESGSEMLVGEKAEQNVEELLRTINAKGILRTQSSLSSVDKISCDEIDSEIIFEDDGNLIEPAVDSERIRNGGDATSPVNMRDPYAQDELSLQLLANHSFEDEEEDEHEDASILLESYQSNSLATPISKKRKNNVKFSQPYSPEKVIVNNNDEHVGKHLKLSSSASSGDRVNIYSVQYLKSQKLREIIKGLISVNDWKNCRVFNIQRINGLEAQPGILFFTDSSMHIINNIQVLDSSKKLSELTFIWIPPTTAPSIVSGSEGNTTIPGESESGTNEAELDNDAWLKSVWSYFTESYQGFLKISVEEIYSFFKRRYELKYTALEITDIRGLAVLFSCHSKQECDFILTSLLEKDLPSSIFNKMIGLKNLQLLRGVHNMYSRLISFFLAALTQLWQHYEITNFEYLMYLNSCAGRSCVDLTQYPVFPWVLQDYTSEELLDLEDPNIYRDFTKPMGAIGQRRASQYYDRYLTMQEFYRDSIQQNELFSDEEVDEGEVNKLQHDGGAKSGASSSPPPFFYGTHYSCAGYVLHYLVRLQPYANMSLALQGGHFDKPDRLFYHLENSWKSASQENLQDVRELIPEFFYLPDFLKNINGFQLGATQRGHAIGDVVLPPWSRGSAEEFIRLHRAALESNHVSRELPAWIDLIFGFKQRGKAAIEARNVFLHITYEGEVDVEKMVDPVLRLATLAQINNFGQTPSQLFPARPHPKRNLPEVLKRVDGNGNIRNVVDRSASTASSQLASAGSTSISLEQSISTTSSITVDHSALSYHIGLAPPLTVVGTTNQLPLLNKVFYGQVANYQITGKFLAVSDIRITKDNKLIACSQGSLFLSPHFRKLVRFQAIADGLCLQNSNLRVEAGTTVSSAVDPKDILYFDQLHSMKITCCAICKDGEFVATGSEDRSVRVWRLIKSASTFSLVPLYTFSGHLHVITCVEIVPEYHFVLTGDAGGFVHVWDYSIGSFVRTLGPQHTGNVLGVSMNSISGYIATITKEQLRVFHVNGTLVSYQNFFSEDATEESDKLHYYQRNQWLDGLKLSHGSAVLVPPSGDWQDGVVAVTGHQEGHVFCWKLSNRMDVVEKSYAERDEKKSPIEESLFPIAVGQYYRRLYIASTPPKVHRSAITTLRLGGNPGAQASFASSLTNFRNNMSVNNTHKEVIHRAYAESRNLELLVGDAEGYVSRWSTVKLEQLSPGELQTIM